MSTWIVFSEQIGPLSGMAGYERIQDLFNRSRLGVSSGGGSWISRVRVTRSGGLTSLGGGRTTAAALYEFPDSYSPALRETALQNLRASFDAMLTADEQSGNNAWSTPIITPYRPQLNGPLDWWQCSTQENCAANTTTRDTSPAMQDLLPENPTGPTIRGLNVPDESAKFSWTPVYIGLGVVALIALAPAVNTIINSVAAARGPRESEPAPAPAIAEEAIATPNPRNKKKKYNGHR